MTPAALRLLCLFCCTTYTVLVAGDAGAAAAAADDDDARLLAAALEQHDECRTTGDNSGGDCALAALQLRGLRATTADDGGEGEEGRPADAEQPLEEDDDDVDVQVVESGGCSVLKACKDSVAAQKLALLAPACVKACGMLCAAAAPFYSAKPGSNAAFQEVACSHVAALRCVMTPAHLVACSPALEQLAWVWPAAPRTPEALDALACTAQAAGGTPRGSTENSLVERALKGQSLAGAQDAAWLDSAVQRKCCPPKSYMEGECRITISYHQTKNCHRPCRQQSRSRICPGNVGCGLFDDDPWDPLSPQGIAQSHHDLAVDIAQSHHDLAHR